ncbi:MAG: helix-turn-helix transcriptional regulator [Candidatus Omnitrophota bacterium]
MRSVNEHLKEKLKDPYFKELYELEEQKLGIVKHIVDYRVKNSLTQKQLARKLGITQQHLSKIENGEFSSVVTLDKVLLFIGFKVRLELVPLQKSVRDKIQRARSPQILPQAA